MSSLIFRWYRAAALFSVVLLATACFQQVGDTAQATAVSERVTETPTDLPTEADIPAASAEETDEPADQETSATPDATATVTDTPTATQYVPSETPTITNTPTAADMPVQDLDPQDTSTPDDFSARATQIIADASATAAFATTEAAATAGLGATETPTPSPTSVAPIVTTAAPQPGSGLTLGGTDCVHEVRQGETLFALFRLYGIPINQLAAVNGIVNPNAIVIGQRIVIPGCGITGTRPPATSTPGPSRTTTPGFGTGGPSTNLPPSNNSHVVQSGETIQSIAALYNLSAQAVAQANGLTVGTALTPGQILTIPPGGFVSSSPSIPSTHVVQSGETIQSIAALYNVTPESLAATNGLQVNSVLTPGQTLQLPPTGGAAGGGSTCGSTYTVQQGDTLYQISLRCNVPLASIANANALGNINEIYVGDVLTIPAR